jgi:hypothetical protein
VTGAIPEAPAVPSGAIQDYGEVFADPALAAREFVVARCP